MANENFFKTSIFGGYKKKDVLRYIKELEENCEKLEVIRQRAEELANSVSTLLENGRLSEEPQPVVQPEPVMVQPQPAVKPEPVMVQPQPVVKPEPVMVQPQPAVKPQLSLSARPEWLPENFSEEDFINLKAKAEKYDAAQNQAGGFAPLFSDSELKDRAMDIENRAWKKAELILSETERTAVKKREEADEALNSELKDTAEKFAAELKLIQDRISTLSNNFPDRLAQRMNQTKVGEEAAGEKERKNG